MNTILKLKKINLKYQTGKDSINVLKNIDLNIKKKEAVSVVGESGSGKTSLIMLIGGLEKPNSGKIIFQDQEITGLSEDEVSEIRKKNIGIIFQSFYLIPNYTAVDEFIPQPDRPKDKPFLMPVEDVFSISGRGTVVTGRVESGVIKTGEEIEIVGIRDTKKSVCTGVEMFRKLLDTGEAGDNIGALLRGVERTDVERGQVLCKPGSVTPHTKFEAQAYVLKKEEGGRHTPFFTKYRPQFYFRTTDVTGEVELPSGTEMVMPGDDAKFTVKLITPIAMSEKLNFAIREGGRTVGAGVVTKIIE